MLITLLWLRTLSQILKPKVNDRVKVTKHKNVYSKVYSEHWLGEVFITYSALKTNSCTYKNKDLNGKKTIGGFAEKELLQSIS